MHQRAIRSIDGESRFRISKEHHTSPFRDVKPNVALSALTTRRCAFIMVPMKLSEYLQKHGLSHAAFVFQVYDRTGTRMTDASVSLIAKGRNCRLSTARAIVEATEGEVAYEDLIMTPDAPADAESTNSDG